MENKDLNNDHTANGMPRTSKSRSKRRPVARAHRYRSRLNDAAAPIPQGKHPNALKHGVFSASPTIPGEDPREFQELHAALIDEYQPAGPSEADAVLSLADLMWRKRRAQEFLRTKLMLKTFDPHSPTFDERRGFNLFIHWMHLEPETSFERHASIFLRLDSIRHLKQKFPRTNYPSTSEWAQAVIMEIKSVLLPAAPPSLEATEPGEGDLPEPLRKMVVERKVSESIQNAKEDFEADLNLRQRLEAMIDRKIKHLIQLKAMKQMLRQTSIEREDEQPRKIAGRSTSRR